MARSSWKFIPLNRSYWQLAVQTKLLEYLYFLKANNLHEQDDINYRIRLLRKSFKRVVTDRSITVTPTLFNTVVYIHKGNKYRRLRLNKFMVGYKLGEFSFTRKPFKYPIKKKKKNFIRR